MKIKPLGERIVAVPSELEKRTASGIIIPEAAQKKNNTAKVLTISEDLKKSETNQLKEGDTILYKDFAGEKLEKDGKEYIIIAAEDIMAIM
jgi:chaperonin GroES